MEQLLEDYKRRLKTAVEMTDAFRIDSDMYARLKTKASCYRTFISELESEIKLKEKE